MAISLQSPLDIRMVTEQDLLELERKIDFSIATQRLLAQPRDIALVHLLRYFEDYVRLYAPKSLDNSCDYSQHREIPLVQGV